MMLLFCAWVSLPRVNAQEVSGLSTPFQHGVASGDPLTDRVIVWTRVSGSENESVEVHWRVSTDPALTNVVQSGLYVTGPYRDYTVKVDVEGLEAGTTYYYGFTALGKSSIVGKTRTAPSSMVDQLKFAVVSCSNLQHGYFNSYGRIADRTDLDAVIHLGDYIYEYSATGEDFYGAASLRDNGERLHVPDNEIVTLEDYRTRYSQYRLDPDLRRVHQQHPFILIWDDHESANDAYEDGAENHQEDEGVWTDRKAIAKQVYDEWMPIRSDLNEFPLYRTISYGDLVDVIMLDTRLEGRDEQILNVLDPALYSSERTILGSVQKEWFFDQLSSSDAVWKVIGNQVIFSEFNVWWAANPADPVLGSPVALESIFLDIWDGYPSEREQIIDLIAGEQTGSPIDNVVVLTGDFHSTFGFDISKRPALLSASDAAIPLVGDAPIPVQPTYDPETGAGSIAVEFATPSVTSANFDENLPPPVAAAFQFQINTPLPDNAGPVAGINPNPHMQYADLNRHGYFILDLTSDHAQADWFFTEDIFTRNRDEVFGEAWFTATGENRLQQSEGPSTPKAEQDVPAPIAPKPKRPELKGQRVEGGITLEWTDVLAEKSYIIERSLGGEGFSELARVDEDVSSYIDESVNSDAEARYRVRATNEAFDSEYSNIVSINTESAFVFSLVDAGSDSVIRPVSQEDIIDLRNGYNQGVSLVAEVVGIEIQFVTFSINGELVQKEFVAPYSLGGDQSGDFASVDALGQVGSYNLEVVAVDVNGAEVEREDIFLQVINSDLYVTDFVLVDAALDQDLAVLPKGKVALNLSDYSASQFSIRAELSSDEAGSVRFMMSEGTERIENVAPFALGGDNNGDYAPVSQLVESGSVTIYATPYTQGQAQGEEGGTLSLTLSNDLASSNMTRSFTSSDFEKVRSGIPEKTVLAGNYPNPFNPTTTIQFGLHEQSQARIVLYDLLGRVVDVVLDDMMSSGWHSVSVDGSGLASGIYIYQLETSNTVLLGQMILQK